MKLLHHEFLLVVTIIFSTNAIGMWIDGWAPYKWVQMGPDSALPNYAVTGGVEVFLHHTGKLYIGRKQIGSSMSIGKVNFDWRTAYFSYYGEEISSDTYEILAGGRGYNHWIGLKSWEVNVSPKQDGGRGENGGTLYVCLGLTNSSKIPGELDEGSGCCYVAAGGKEYCLKDYEFLSPANWYSGA